MHDVQPDPDLKYAADFSRLADELHQERHERPTLERIAALAVETVDSCDYCGVSLRHSDGTITTAASTSDIASRADALEYELGEGPCLESIWQADTFLINDLSTETRWPRWASLAAELGIGAVLAVRLEPVDGQPVAALNLYSATPQAFDHTDVAIQRRGTDGWRTVWIDESDRNGVIRYETSRRHGRFRAVTLATETNRKSTSPVITLR